jgi:hypothetical protein
LVGFSARDAPLATFWSFPRATAKPVLGTPWLCSKVKKEKKKKEKRSFLISIQIASVASFPFQEHLMICQQKDLSSIQSLRRSFLFLFLRTLVFPNLYKFLHIPFAAGLCLPSRGTSLTAAVPTKVALTGCGLAIGLSQHSFFQLDVSLFCSSIFLALAWIAFVETPNRAIIE